MMQSFSSLDEKGKFLLNKVMTRENFKDPRYIETFEMVIHV